MIVYKTLAGSVAPQRVHRRCSNNVRAPKQSKEGKLVSYRLNSEAYSFSQVFCECQGGWGWGLI